MKGSKKNISASAMIAFQNNMCLRKKPYATEEAAKKACKAIWKRKKYYMKCYICPIHAAKGQRVWHIAKDWEAMWAECKKTS
jgi:hypothetical protein